MNQLWCYGSGFLETCKITKGTEKEREGETVSTWTLGSSYKGVDR